MVLLQSGTPVDRSEFTPYTDGLNQAKAQKGGVFRRPRRGGPQKRPPATAGRADLLAAASRLLESERVAERDFNQALVDALGAYDGTRAGALAASAMVQGHASARLGTGRTTRRRTRPGYADVGLALEALAVHQGMRGTAASARAARDAPERAVTTLEHFLSTPPDNPFAGLQLTGPGRAPAAAGTAFTFGPAPAAPPGGFDFGSPPRAKSKSPPKTQKKKTKTKSPAKGKKTRKSSQ